MTLTLYQEQQAKINELHVQRAAKIKQTEKKIAEDVVTNFRGVEQIKFTRVQQVEELGYVIFYFTVNGNPNRELTYGIAGEDFDTIIPMIDEDYPIAPTKHDKSHANQLKIIYVNEIDW